MALLLVILVGVLYGAGVYLMFRRSMVGMLLGLLLIGNGANILIFLIGGITKGKAPIIAADEKYFTDIYAEPIPQSLILTALVISFAVAASGIVLLRKVDSATRSDRLDS